MQQIVKVYQTSYEIVGLKSCPTWPDLILSVKLHFIPANLGCAGEECSSYIGLFHLIGIHPPRKSVNHVPGGCSQIIKSQGVKTLK